MRCPACDASNAATARFCDQCGTPLTDAASGSAGSPADKDPESSPGDRRIVTALFADIVEYSRLVAQLDAEEVAGRIEAAFRVLAAAVERYEGTVEKFIGDAVFAVFGARRAHDDDAVRAALCGLAMAAALDAPAGDRGLVVPLRLRIGIATGEVVAQTRRVGGQRDLTVTGETVTTAMRLQEMADPGEILLDEATLRAGRNRLDTEPLGERSIRGRSQPVRVHRLRGERAHRFVGSAGAGLLIGRHADRRLLSGALAASAKSGMGRVVLLVGEAGIGKSRLVADLEEEARGLGYAWTWTENLSYTVGEPYGFARSLAQRIADEHGTDSGALTRRLLFTDDLEPTITARLAGGVAAIARDAAFSGWETEAALVPADPAEVRAALVDVAARYIRRLADLSGPRVVVIDDMHWADASSLPMIDQVVRVVADLPFVLFIATRPAPPPEWAGLDHVTTLMLGGLDPTGTERLAAVIAGAELAEGDARLVHDRTAGNPLFVGETVRSLLEDGGLEQRDGRLRLVDPTAIRALPVNLRGVLGARIDGLEPDLRAALEVASVIGMTFEPAVIGALLASSDDAAVEAVLGRLADASLVVPGSAEWRFHHPLIHDVVYAGMLTVRRRQLHARLADLLEAATGPPPAVAQLAHHRALAGDRDRAVPLLGLAAESALAVGATTEAARYWRTAADLLGDDPAAEAFRLRISQVEAQGSQPEASRSS